MDIPQVDRKGRSVAVLIRRHHCIQPLEPQRSSLNDAADGHSTGGIVRFEKGVELLVDTCVLFWGAVALPDAVRLVANDPHRARISSDNGR